MKYLKRNPMLVFEGHSLIYYIPRPQHKMLSFSNGYEMKENIEGSVNLTVYCRGHVQKWCMYSKHIPVFRFSEGPSQFSEITHFQFLIVIFKRLCNENK